MLASWNASAVIRSNSGNIHFDTNNDGVVEMAISGNGLLIGSGLASANLEVQGKAIITHKLSVGQNTSATSNLSIQGTMGMSMQRVSSSANLDTYSKVLANTENQSITLTLLLYSSEFGRLYKIKKIHTNNSVIITRDGLIDAYNSGFTLDSGF